MSISFTTIVKNEEKNVAALVEAVKPFVDELIFVDTGSEDRTVKFLESLGATVLFTTMDNGFAAARNYGLDACSCSWILSLDADERPTSEMMKYCAAVPDRIGDEIVGVTFVRKNRLDGHFLHDERHLRLFRKDLGRWEGTIHESVQVKGKVAQAHKRLYIEHDKASTRQAEQNRQYLQFYPKFNLGSGGNPKLPEQGWVNYDIDTSAPMAEYADVTKELPHPLPASYILASHILEHTSYHTTSKVLKLWIDKLAPGGTIEVRVPDLSKLVRMFVSGRIHYLRFIQLMYGGQTTEYDYHYIAIDESWLRGQFGWWGLEDIQVLHPTDEYELRMTARKPL